MTDKRSEIPKGSATPQDRDCFETEAIEQIRMREQDRADFKRMILLTLALMGVFAIIWLGMIAFL